MAQEHSPGKTLPDSDGATNVSGYVDDWQSGRDFIQTNLMMLDSEALADARFKVGEDGEVIRAHKFILASRSCVFFAMFCGSVAETGEINVTDIDAQTFIDFLRYLYTGVMSLTPDNALNLLYCSKKYCVKGLEQEIIEYLKTCISADNACTLLEQACLYDEADLQQAILAIIMKDATQVLQSDCFKSLSQANLDRIIASDDIKADEDVIYKAAINWAKAECTRKSKEATTSEIRNMLGDSLLKIRFPLMPQSVFVELVGSAGILTDGEKVKILERYISPRSQIEPFNGRPRDTRPIVHTIQRLVHGDEGYPLSKSSDVLLLSCDKPTTVIGILLYAPANISTTALSYLQSFLDASSTPQQKRATYHITIDVRDSKNVTVAKYHEDREVSDADRQFKVSMNSPVNLDVGKAYTLNVHIEGPVKCWGVMNTLQQQTDLESDVTWTFGNSVSKRKCVNRCEDSLKEGHISGLLYCLRSDV